MDRVKENKCNTALTYTVCGDSPTPATFYVFSSPPQPIWGRPKYRNNVPRPRGIHDYYNMMWDPRVRRGDPLRKFQQKQEMEKCLKPKQKVKKQANYRPRTPPPVEGRDHCQMQTENFWESLDVDVTTCEAKIQTFPVQDLPVNPWFTPSKLGEDKATEILPGDLFNFDCEIQPVVESLVGKVLEQALLECMEEEELLTLKDQQMLFEERRRLEQLRLERLKDREQCMNDEKERLMKEMEQRKMYEDDVANRSGASVFASLYLTDMKQGTVRALRSDGFINSMRVISTVFLPWLNCQVESELARMDVAQAVLDDIIRCVVNNREDEYAAGKNPWHPPPTTPVGEYVGEGE